MRMKSGALTYVSQLSLEIERRDGNLYQLHSFAFSIHYNLIFVVLQKENNSYSNREATQII